jgi:hypothetical protein
MAELPLHTLLLPLMEAGAEGFSLMVTARVSGGEEPQPLQAVTAMVPPAVPAVAVMEVVFELPVQPGGRVQV